MANYEIKDYPSYKAKLQGQAKEQETWTFKDFMKKDGKALARMKIEKPQLFAQLFKNQYGKFPIL